MRSRYAAYATGNLDYIAATCAGPAALSFKRADAEIAQLGTRWSGLEIIETRKGGVNDTEGSVRFIAHFRHNGQDGTQSEVSKFRRVDDAWFYWDREWLENPPARALNIGRNDPCPCGSGKKYKKCCGATA